MLARFQPTIICVERLPQQTDALNLAYRTFLQNPAQLSTQSGELSLIAFNVTRLNKLAKRRL
jgi:hypothetical protein